MTERPAPPIALLAELTHRCPLSCSYCSNPLELTAREKELPTEIWVDVFQQAADDGRTDAPRPARDDRNPALPCLVHPVFLHTQMRAPFRSMAIINDNASYSDDKYAYKE